MNMRTLRNAPGGMAGRRFKNRGRKPAVAPVGLQGFEEAARQNLSAATFDFLVGGAADEHTIRWNREAYDRIRLRPRVLVDVSSVDTRVTLLGLDLPHPILLAPVAYQKLSIGRASWPPSAGPGRPRRCSSSVRARTSRSRTSAAPPPRRSGSNSMCRPTGARTKRSSREP